MINAVASCARAVVIQELAPFANHAHNITRLEVGPLYELDDCYGFTADCEEAEHRALERREAGLIGGLHVPPVTLIIAFQATREGVYRSNCLLPKPATGDFGKDMYQIHEIAFSEGCEFRDKCRSGQAPLIQGSCHVVGVGLNEAL